MPNTTTDAWEQRDVVDIVMPRLGPLSVSPFPFRLLRNGYPVISTLFPYAKYVIRFLSFCVLLSYTLPKPGFQVHRA